MNLDQALHKLGVTTLRAFQSELLKQLCNGRDICCFSATSSGKSLIFQMLAPLLDRLVVVIEPYLSLEVDQVDGLIRKGLSAANINSKIPETQRQQILQQIREGSLQLLYLTPEMLQNKAVKKALHESNLAGIMVDEAHCIVKQGPGFRGDYLRIGTFIRELPQRPLVGAFTATATQATSDSISEKLCLEDPYIYRGGVTRDNIRLSAIEIGNGLGGKRDAEIIEKRKRERICKLLDKVEDGKCIIYCNTVKRVEKLYHYLHAEGYKVSFFHGKCDHKEERVRAFAQGKEDIMVCTNAFGLGINIPDIRLIIHHSPLIGLDDYVQEAGRAGRDGKASTAVLLWHEYDFTINRRLIEKASDARTGKEQMNMLAALQSLHTYAKNSQACRWQLIREFFGEEKGKKCKKDCDNCRKGK